MKLVVRLLAYPVMVLAGIGVLASFVLTATSIAAHSDLGKVGAHFLVPGIFVVWLPTILFANVLGADFKQRDIWKATLRGCPQWMRITQWVIIGIVFVTFFFPFLWGSKPEKSPGTFLLFPSIFYAVSFCTAYSILHVAKIDAGRRCLNGHRITPFAKFCEECGAPAAPEGAEQQGTF
jgi:hypothetical protein